MPTKLQITKNLKLSEQLLDYLSKHPGKGSNESVSYIIITKEDKKLNEMNLSLVKSLIKEEKKVIKAIETKDKNSPWKFTPIFA